MSIPNKTLSVQNESHTGPAVMAAAALVMGIYFGTSHSIHWIIPSASALFSLCCWVFLRKHTALGSMFAVASIFFSGMVAVSVSSNIHRPVGFNSNYINQTVTMTGTIAGEPRRYHRNAARVTVDIDTIEPLEGVFNARGRIPVYLYRQIETGLAEGAHISVRGTVKRCRSHSRSLFTHRIVVGNGNDHFAELTISSSSPFIKIREKLSTILNRYDFNGNREVVRAITIGDRSRLPRSTSAAFARSGIAHVLAVSGLHTAIVTLLVGFILGLFAPDHRFRALIMVATLTLYAGICGFRPPVVRAALMIGSVTVSRILGRQGQRENTLAAILIIILALDPEALFGPSLQLSFAAVWGIITFYDPMMRHFLPGGRNRKYIQFFLSPLVISLIATVTTSPVIAVHFGELPLLALITNLPAVLLMMLIVPMSWVALAAPLLGQIGDPVGAMAATFAGWLIAALQWGAGHIASLHYATIPLSIPPIAAIIIGIGAFLFSRHASGRTYRKASLWSGLIALTIIVWAPLVGAVQQSRAAGQAVFFDVGQGDAILMKYANGLSFLIDTGPAFKTFDSASSVILPYLKQVGITRLNGLFISHCHTDHTGGMESILTTIAVDNVYSRDAISDSLRSAFGREITGLSAGDSLAFDGGGILVMSPHENTYDTENNSSLVLRADIGTTRILLTGDIEEDMQKHLLPWGQSLASDVLKAPHHGGNLSAPFLVLTDPVATIISCGYANRYGHPDAHILSVIKAHRTTLYRTDQDGTIVIELPSLIAQHQ